MRISAGILRQHVEYSIWANVRLLEAATMLSPDELTRDFGTADRSVVGTLAHIFGAERIWLARVQQRTAPQSVSDHDRRLDTLSTEWVALFEQWRDWAASLCDDETDRALEYSDTRGRPWRNSLSDIVLHVVNHSTHHRGQVSGFLRALGRVPPPLDLIAFVREQQRG
jgi:uncharacterized damage-inducible protein DinB